MAAFHTHTVLSLSTITVPHVLRLSRPVYIQFFQIQLMCTGQATETEMQVPTKWTQAPYVYIYIYIYIICIMYIDRIFWNEYKIAV